VLIAAHARWDGPHSPDLLEWLQLAGAQPGSRDLLAARLADDPGDVPALRARQDGAGGDRTAVCAGDLERAAAEPGRADLAYVAARCGADQASRDAAFDVGRRRWPDNAWFAYATAYTAAGKGHWQAALQGMQQAYRGEPALRGYLAVDIARLRRMQATDPQVALADLAKDSPQLHTLVALERNADVGEAMRGYQALGQGRLDEALRLMHGNPDEARVLRLAAASDGARPEWIGRARTLPADQGIDATTVWSAMALEMREGGRGDSFDAVLAPWRTSPETSHVIDATLGFLRFAHAGKLDQAQAQLDGLPPAARGEAYAAGVVLLGSRAPAAWRVGARCLLFAPERPYLG